MQNMIDCLGIVSFIINLVLTGLILIFGALSLSCTIRSTKEPEEKRILRFGTLSLYMVFVPTITFLQFIFNIFYFSSIYSASWGATIKAMLTTDIVNPIIFAMGIVEMLQVFMYISGIAIFQLLLFCILLAVIYAILHRSLRLSQKDSV